MDLSRLDDAPNSPDSPSRAVPVRAATAAAIGHIVEYYDFTIYALLAPVLAPIFFPSHDRTTSLLTAFAVFGVAYVIRPLGGVIFGHFADRVGRRVTLSTVILLMSGATALVGLLPGYDQVGVIAPVLLVFCRSMQGLSIGGEYGGSASFVAEHAPPGRRGLYTSWLIGSSGLGLTLGALVGTLLTSVISRETIASWGWRIPFLMALPLGLVGLYLRLKLDDTSAHRAARGADQIPRLPVVMALRRHPRAIVTLVGMVLLLTAAIYVFFVYLTTYLNVFLDVPLKTAMRASVVGFLTFFVLTPCFGRLSDRVGRRPVMIAGAVAHVALTLPAFLLLQQRAFLAIACTYALFGLIYAAYLGPFTAAVTEQFPTAVRAASLGIGYNLPVCVFGGLSPLVLTYLIRRFDSPLIPAYYVMSAAVISLLVVAFALREVDQRASSRTTQGATAAERPRQTAKLAD